MDEKLRKDVEAVVAKIFSEKEEDEIRKQTEEALNTSAETIEELTDTLEAKNVEFEEIQSKLTEAEEKAKNLQTELEATKEELEGAKNKLSESEATLEEMKKDKATELRMSELEKAGVVSDKEAQAVKVRDMSDEDFASYKSELESLRAAILAAFEKSKEVEEEETAEAETPESKEAGEESEEGAEAESEEGAESEESEEASEEGESEEAAEPAHIDPQHAMSAALNFEIYPDEGMKEKYAKLGQAMASLMVRKD